MASIGGHLGFTFHWRVSIPDQWTGTIIRRANLKPKMADMKAAIQVNPVLLLENILWLNLQFAGVKILPGKFGRIQYILQKYSFCQSCFGWPTREKRMNYLAKSTKFEFKIAREFQVILIFQRCPEGLRILSQRFR